jgi:hypothetical protein
MYWVSIASKEYHECGVCFKKAFIYKSMAMDDDAGGRHMKIAAGILNRAF